MSNNITKEELAFRAIEGIREASKRAHKYNDYGSAMGIQDELSEILEQFTLDMHKASRLSRRLIMRIDKWESGKPDVSLLGDSLET